MSLIRLKLSEQISWIFLSEAELQKTDGESYWSLCDCVLLPRCHVALKYSACKSTAGINPQDFGTFLPIILFMFREISKLNITVLNTSYL